MSQKGVHDLFQARMAGDIIEDNPLKGKRIYIHSPSFKVGIDEALGAAMDGPPAWVLRLKRIENWMDRTLAAAREVWMETAVARWPDGARFRAEWLDYVESVDYERVNQWIKHHNEYFPIEANLPYDIRTGKIMWGARPFRKKDLITPRWLLEHYPPELEQAMRHICGKLSLF